MSRLVVSPRVYDLIQRGLGYELTARRLRAALADAGDDEVLDVGAGTGNLALLLPRSARYVALEPDPQKLARLREKLPLAQTLERSSTATGLPDGGVGWTVCVSVLHHLDDEQLSQTIPELARITRRCLIVAEPVWDPRWLPGRLLWCLDRGDHPRRPKRLLELIGERFEPVEVEHYRGAHRYLLYVGRPRAA